MHVINRSGAGRLFVGLVAVAAALAACRGIAGVETIPVLAAPDASMSMTDAGIDSASPPQETSVADDGSSLAQDAGAQPTDGAPPVCPVAEVTCGTAMVCLQTDPTHCGRCDNDCTSASHVNGATTTCNSGACVYQCVSGYANCGDAGAGCPTSLDDPSTCGSCSTVCPMATPYCSAGTGGGNASCTSNCSGATPNLCGNACVDNQTDQNHCGVSCGPCTNQTCVTGACTGQCAPGQVSCMGAVPQTCGSGGQWVAGAVTPGKCGAACTLGATQCVSGAMQTCDSTGTWVPAAVTPGTCGAVCSPNATQCAGGGMQTCGTAGQWGTTSSCTGAKPFCAAGACATEPPSCQAGGKGAGLNCGGAAGTTDCCQSLEIPATSTLSVFDRDYNGSYPAQIAAFRLDTFEVTVGRFRTFAAALAGGWTPPNASGIHTHLNGGMGLSDSGSSGAYEKGWDATDWNPALAPLASSATTRFSGETGATWTSAVGSNENLPIMDVNWYEAYAFCIWDGGFLPSEAEWNYVAEAGTMQYYYPFGQLMSTHGSITNYAVIACGYPSGTTSTTCIGNISDIAPVGVIPVNGTGYWGQFDLGGNAAEWNLDWYVNPYATNQCNNCSDLTTPLVAHPQRGIRGGSYDEDTSYMFNSTRSAAEPAFASEGVGIRCARTP